MALAASLIALVGESVAEPRDVRDPQGRPVRINATAFQPPTGDGDTPLRVMRAACLDFTKRIPSAPGISFHPSSTAEGFPPVI